MKMLANTLKLYCSPYSPPARSVFLVIKALNLNVKFKTVDILSRDYLNSDLLVINPQHTVPTLKDDNYIVWDSHAIAGYLVGTYAKDDTLYPKNPQRRAIVDQRLHFDTEHLLPKAMEAIQPLLFEQETTIPDRLQRNINRSYGFLENFLTNSKWLAGDDMTIADLCSVSSISTLDYLVPIESDECPNLANFVKQCSQLPYYYEANQIGLNMLGNKIHERMITTCVKKLYNM